MDVGLLRYIYNKKGLFEGLDSTDSPKPPQASGAAVAVAPPPPPVEEETHNTPPPPPQPGLGQIVLALLISFYSAWLSWSSNTLEGRDIFEKLIFAFLAFTFGTLYLFYFILFRESFLRLRVSDVVGNQ
jgi:hypothetical protein